LGQIVYVCNGTDSLKAVTLAPVPTIVNDPFLIGSLTQTGGVATEVADTGSDASIPTGTYSYVYAVYDTTLKKWTQRADTQTILVKSVNTNVLNFTAPTFNITGGGAFTLGTNEKLHLFLARANDPIEFATDQTAGGLALGDFPIKVRQVSTDGTPVPIRGTSHTGNLLLAHRNRLWVSGDQTAGNASRVYATSVILAGN